MRFALKRARSFAVITSLAVVGALFGALAGAATFAVGVFAISLRNGELVWPITLFGSLFGGFVGSALGFVLGAALPVTPWRHVPVGRLFVHLTIGTIIGGGACSIVIGHPAFAILGGVGGYFIAGDRLARRHAATPSAALDSQRIPPPFP